MNKENTKETRKATVNYITEDNVNKILAIAKQLSSEHAIATPNSKGEYCVEMFSSAKKERCQVWICKQHVDIYVSSKVENIYNTLDESEQYKRGTTIDTTQRKRVYKSIDDMISFLSQFVIAEKKTTKTTKAKTTKRKETKSA